MSKIDKRTKWSYAVGCIGRDMNFVLVSLFVLPYIQYTMNLTVAQFSAISAIMIFARLWDAINDPMMGMIIENSHLKKGKFKPWILMGGILNSCVTLLLFFVRPTGWAFVLFFGIFYILWGMTFTMNDISYYALLPNLAKDNDSRNSLTNLVQLFASIGQFVAGGLIPVLVTGNAVTMYRIIGVVVALLFTTFTIITYLGVTENPRVDNKQKLSLKNLYTSLLRNDQLVVAAIGLLLYTIAHELFISLSINYFYFHFGYGGAQITLFTVTFALGTLLAIAAFGKLSKKHKRLNIMRFGLTISTIGYIIFISIGTILPLFELLLYMASLMIFFGHGLFFVIFVVLIANTIEYNFNKFGDRNEAVVFSVRPFMTKLGAAIQQLLLTLILITTGVYSYSQNIAKLELEKSQGILSDITQQANTLLQQADEPMKLMLRLFMGLLPLICISLAYIFTKKKYIITEELFESWTKKN